MPRDLSVFPERFLERLRRIIPPTRWEAVARSFTKVKPTTFRLNSLKSSFHQVREELTARGLHIERVQWYPDAFVLRRGHLRDLQETETYQAGAIYVQALSSMLPPLILDPQPTEVVLDLTAAPGSKTTQMACLMQGRGKLVANDNNKVRFFRLRANVMSQAASNVQLSMRYGEVFGKRDPDTYDRVLLDAPCSAEGRFSTQEPKSYKFWKPGKVREMARKQRRLLVSAVDALKPGGSLVYATCTFAPEENEGVIDWILNRYHKRISLSPIKLGFTNYLPGMKQWDKHTFDPSIVLTRRVLPTADMEGFFLAKLLKHAHNESF